MITTVELLKKLVGKNLDINILPGGGNSLIEKRKRGDYVITDVGEQFIEAEASSSGNTKKYYFNINFIQRIVFLG